MKNMQPQQYRKHHSFEAFKSDKDGVLEYQVRRALRVLKDWRSGVLKVDHPILKEENFEDVISSVEKDLAIAKPDSNAGSGETIQFKITPFIAEEMATYSDEELLRFFYHRYRYDIFPQIARLDKYPPYLQIEPSALCNFRCVFCYQTDIKFFNRSNDAMGHLSVELFREVVDKAFGRIEFISLASRGEPLMNRNIDQMLKYAEGKFLNLKVNTNASLLNEKNIHALLSGGAKTIVFSADAAEEPLYSQLRVNGKLERVLKNIELLCNIREKHYSNLKIITRVSGVKVNDKQSISDMERLWGGIVDQVAFVSYNPWENIYEAEPNGLKAPCSDLWRRMFVWHDGSTNPCDTDYKSFLSMGHVSKGISDIWTSEDYQHLRKAHSGNSRQLVEPCKRCSVV